MSVSSGFGIPSIGEGLLPTLKVKIYRALTAFIATLISFIQERVVVSTHWEKMSPTPILDEERIKMCYLDELPTLLLKHDHLCHHKACVVTPSAILSLQN